MRACGDESRIALRSGENCSVQASAATTTAATRVFMSTNTSPCDGLVGHVRNVCTGEAGIKPCLRRRYIRHWLSIGLIPRDPDQREDSNGRRAILAHRIFRLPRRILRFTKALLVHLADRLQQAPAAVQQRRMETCRVCPSFKDSKCEVCSCNLRVKVRWRTSKCPQGKWENS